MGDVALHPLNLNARCSINNLLFIILFIRPIASVINKDLAHGCADINNLGICTQLMVYCFSFFADTDALLFSVRVHMY